MKLEHSPTPNTKINPKWLKDLSRRHDTIKLLEENKGKIFSDINHSNIFLDQFPKAKEIKAKNKEMGSNQTYKLLHSKGNQKPNKLPMEWEKIFANDTTNKGLNTKYTNSSYNIKKIPIKKMGRSK